MAAALGDVSKSQVDRLFRVGMPRSSVEAARAWRMDNLELSRTSDSRIDRPQPAVPNAPAAIAGLTSTSGRGEPPQPASAEEPAGDENTAAYRVDRARNERIKADRAEIELQQLRGELVPLRDVEELEFTAGRITRDRVLMVPARIAADMHALALTMVPEHERAAFGEKLQPHALERRLDAALRDALSEAAKAIEDARRDDDADQD